MGTTSFGVAIAGIVAGCCDAVENGFIILMINNPVAFPDIYALIHSYFALTKFILLGLSIIWIIVMMVVVVVLLFRKRRSLE